MARKEQRIIPGLVQPPLWEAAPDNSLSAEQSAPPQVEAANAIVLALPVDPEAQALLPEDLREYITHIPRYMMPETQQNSPVIHLLHTPFFILSYDPGKGRDLRHHGGIVLQGETPEQNDARFISYSSLPTWENALKDIRNAAVARGLLDRNGFYE